MSPVTARSHAIGTQTSRRHGECPLCSAPDLDYEFIVDGYPVCICRRCSLMFLNPGPDPDVTAAPIEEATPGEPGVYDVRAAGAASRLKQFTAYAGLKSGRLLVAATGGQMETEAIRRGFDVVALSVPELENGRLAAMAPGSADACLLYCTLERTSDPEGVLRAVRNALVPGGSLMVVSPTLDARTARLFRSQWWEFRRENRFYFSADTLQSLLVKAGFGDPIITRDDATVSLQSMGERLATLRPRLRYRLLRLALSASPGFLRHRAFRFLYSRTAVMVRSKQQLAVPRLSVIVPAYNESSTFTPMMERLMAKTLEGIDIEVIVVEGGSNDGTREQVLRYQGHPRVRVILEDRPRGKGHAVRKGLEVATGDVILFQDADLEYDIDDYGGLLQPLLRYQRNFVIGSRHILKGQVWKVRQFNDAAGMAALFNFGHVVFLTLFNLIYQQRLKDPFSMFKVFRRDCLYGLRFESDRFDFDFEIVIKLLRKGYRPVELPVNYSARSFAQGKKVSVLRDPLTWLRALAKFRSGPLYPGGTSDVA